MPKRTYRRTVGRRRKRYGGKRRKTFRKGGYRSRSSARSVAKYTSIIRPITLKPKFQMRRMQYYNTLRLDTGLGQSGQQADIIKSTVPIFFKLRLNSPYPFHNLDGLSPMSASPLPFTQYTGNTNWNSATVVHSNGQTIDQGTAYEGWRSPGSPAYSYQQWAILGTKVTMSYTPIGNSNSTTGAQPTAFFAFIETQPGAPTIRQQPRVAAPGGTGPSVIADIYERPYCKVRKILPTKVAGGSAGNISYGGGGTSAALTFNYSPKRMNGVKDIADNQSLWGNISYVDDGQPTTNPKVNHPAEGDYLVVGIMPLMDDLNTGGSTNDPVPLQSGMLQLKMETVCAFREPIDAHAIGNTEAAGNVELGGGGDAMAGVHFARMAGAAAAGFAGL